MIPGIKATPIIRELGQIQHKCSDICNCDRLSEELKSKVKVPDRFYTLPHTLPLTTVGA